MQRIAKLDPSYDLWLTYSWSSNDHGVCGHLYEVIDYFWLLKDHYKVGILICENLVWDTIQQGIQYKYDFTQEEIDLFKSHCVFLQRPSLVQGRNILFTDGGVVNMRSKTLLFDNILYFACGNLEVSLNDKANTWILQDNRVYEPVKRNGIDYKKRILFSRLKSVSTSCNKKLIYATKNCRSLTDFDSLRCYGNLLAIVNTIPNLVNDIEFVIPPVEDIFSRFDTYIYTPVERKWDCSPRFIAECRYYGKEVIYHNIDYWHLDHGLRWRKWDIDNDFNSLFLNKDDALLDILDEIL